MSSKDINLFETIVKRTLRVPYSPLTRAVSEDTRPSTLPSDIISLQFDGVLIENGFKASPELIGYIASQERAEAIEITRKVLGVVKQLVGSHVQHNTYFKNFPNYVPDTREFWAQLVIDTFGEGNEELWDGNLLALDGYGQYLHTFEEMVKMHEPLVGSKGFKARVVELGGSLDSEARALYKTLAESKIPLNNEDKVILEYLAGIYFDVEFESIPQRETRATINAIRIKNGHEVFVDTLTDVLRIAVQLSDGDVSLQTKTKFKSLPKAQRRILLKAINDILEAKPAKIADAYKIRETWKKLLFRLQINTLSNYPHAQKLIDYVYNGKNGSFEAQLEVAFEKHDLKSAVEILKKNPGLYAKSLNRVLMNAKLGDVKLIVDSFSAVADKISSPVLIGLIQYLDNRLESKTDRIFANRKGTAHLEKDEQSTLPEDIVTKIKGVISAEITGRFKPGKYAIGQGLGGIAVPLSNKLMNSGLDILPKGSVDLVYPEVLRFFIYWHEDGARTDYDLSAIFLDENFNMVTQVSFTNLRSGTVVHSGDITSAPNGASEFIDVTLGELDPKIKFIVPQINLYSGNKFDEAKEAFFGYMERTVEQKGLPFEAKTVATKSDLFGGNNVAMPLFFSKEEDGWKVKWLHLNLKGYGWANSTENNKVTTASLVRSVYETEYITIPTILSMLANAEGVMLTTFEDFEGLYTGQDDFDASEWTFIGRDVPASLPKETKRITLGNIQDLLP